MFLPYPHRVLARFRAKNPIFACFPLSRPISDLCPRAAAVTQTATSRGNTRPTTNRRATPEDKQKKRAGWEKAWGAARARPSGKKAGMGGDLRFGCKTRMRGGFYVLLCIGDTRGAEGGVREVDRGAVEDCLIGKPARGRKSSREVVVQNREVK